MPRNFSARRLSLIDPNPASVLLPLIPSQALWQDLIEDCVQDSASQRPSAGAIVSALKRGSDFAHETEPGPLLNFSDSTYVSQKLLTLPAEKSASW